MVVSYITSLLIPKRLRARTLKACDHRLKPSLEACPECYAEKRRSRKYRWKVILGLVFPAALHALDATM
jgi:hypothetical protein